MGPDTRDNLFGENSNPIGEKIKVGSQQYTVIGVTISKGGTGFGSSDDLIYIPIATAQHYITGSDSVSSIDVQVSEENLMDQVQAKIETLLLVSHGIKNIEEADFNIMNQADIMDTMSSITGTLTLLLASIAGISLIVGGIGIMNMMLITVSERTKEIGLRKSLGAKNKDINNQFLVESVALTFIGGIIGVILGITISTGIESLGIMTTSITSWSIFLSCGVSILTGIIFGYYPAKRAGKLDPIEVLRYE